MVSTISSIYDGVVNDVVSELLSLRQTCLQLLKNYIDRWDQVQGVAPEVSNECCTLDEDRGALFDSICNHWIRANQICDAGSLEGRAQLNAMLKAVERMRRDYASSCYFDEGFFGIGKNKLQSFVFQLWTITR